MISAPFSANRPLSTELPQAIPFTDQRLMEMIQSHHPHGLSLLHLRFAALLKVLAMNVLHNYADAEELLQDVFLEIWNRAVNFDPLKGEPLAWITTLTRRRAIDRLRKRDTYKRFEERLAAESKLEPSGWTHVHEDLSLSESKGHLQRAMATLPLAQRSAIELAYVGSMTHRQIAQSAGIPLGTVKTRLELGLKKLHIALFEFDGLLGVAPGQNFFST